MERVAFLVESTGERIRCMLNPENLVIRRCAGVRTRRSHGGLLTGAALEHDPVLFTGGGQTEVLLELLFDVSLEDSWIVASETNRQLEAGAERPDKDVRDLTQPLWELAENSEQDSGYGRPPLVRFLWGKSWNIPGVITAVAERLEQFTPQGVPTRSWLSMRLLQVPEPAGPPTGEEAPRGPIEVPEPSEGSELYAEPESGSSIPDSDVQVHQCVAGERLDQIVQRYYGDSADPSLWRALAAYNGLADPLHLPAGLGLQIPSLSTFEARG